MNEYGTHGQTFGAFLAYLRKRARLTQSELGRAVGYSREQITRLEKNQRAPDAQIVAARFVHALGLENEPALSARLLELAAPSHSSHDAGVQDRPHEGFNNLPAPLLPLVGREQEGARLRERLRGDARLLTLTGAAGVGKTRLAIHAARTNAEAFRDGVCFVSLAPLTDAALIPAALAHALEWDTRGVAELEPFLFSQLRAKHFLFVLDNFEQLLAPSDGTLAAPGAAQFVSALLTHAPDIKILVTSRASLNLYGEYQFPLTPLALPDTLDSEVSPPTHVSNLQSFPSIALFVQRAQQVLPQFQLDDTNASRVVSICAQLDGLPLALEIAAAQLKQFSLDELEHGLKHNALAMNFPAPNLPERHHSLTNALAWSYEHLSADEKRVLEWLGVFAGGATAELFQELGLVENARAVLDALVEISLVQTETVRGETRYTMFETVRQFARETLTARGAQHQAQQRHAELYLALAERAEPYLTGAAQHLWLNRLDAERDNFRRALAWTLDTHQTDAALRLCNALWKFWRYRCDLAEGYEWTLRALQTFEVAQDLQGLSLRASAEWGAGLLAAVMQREEQATAHLEQSLQLWQQVEDDAGVASALTALGARAMYRGEYPRAVELQTQALALYAQLGDDAALAYAHNALGETLRAGGNLHASQTEYESSLFHAQRAGHARSIAVAQSNLASVELALGKSQTARERLARSLPTFIELNDRVNIASCIATLACADAQREPPELIRATQLFAFATQLLEQAHGKFEAADAIEFEKWLAHCRAELGADDFERARQKGAALMLEDVLFVLT